MGDVIDLCARLRRKAAAKAKHKAPRCSRCYDLGWLHVMPDDGRGTVRRCPDCPPP